MSCVSFFSRIVVVILLTWSPILLASETLFGLNDVQEFLKTKTSSMGHKALLVQDGDQDKIVSFAKNKAYKAGIPDDPKAWTENLLVRQSKLNYFTALVFEDVDSEISGIMGLGIMPVLTGYKAEEHKDILELFVNLGVLKKKEVSGPLSEENLEREGNRGFTSLLPIIVHPETQSKPGERHKGKVQRMADLYDFIVQTSLKYVDFLASNKHSHPRDNSDPYMMLALVDTQHPLNPYLTDFNFSLLEKKGFQEFYHKQRTVASLSLEDARIELSKLK